MDFFCSLSILEHVYVFSSIIQNSVAFLQETALQYCRFWGFKGRILKEGNLFFSAMKFCRAKEIQQDLFENL